MFKYQTHWSYKKAIVHFENMCVNGTNKIHPRQIGFDIDGVVADTVEAFIRIARQDYGLDRISPADITEFEVERCLDVDPPVVQEIFTRLLQNPLAVGLKPMPHAVTVLGEFAQFAPLTFVTARQQEPPIAEWLATALGQDIFDRSRLVAMGDHDKKAQYIKELGLDYFVDDRAQTCVILNQYGITPMVYSQPWNHGKHDLQTVENWQDIRELCFD